MATMIPIFDNGHGWDTPGKCSPDRSLLEWKWNREIVDRVIAQLKTEGYNPIELVPEDKDISLGERVRRVNSLCTRYGTPNCLFISVHCNAAGGDGKWHNGVTGISFWTSVGQTKGDKLADCCYEVAVPLCNKFGKKILTQRYKDGDIDYEKNFTVLAKTKCAACLIENWFMDNQHDAAWLLSEEGKQTAVDIIVGGVKLYIKKYATK